MNRRTLIAALAGAAAAHAQNPTPGLPNIGLRADMPWADVLWATTYNSHTPRTGTGLGLWPPRSECGVGALNAGAPAPV